MTAANGDGRDLLYRRPVSVWWWTRKRSYFLFVMRELSSLFIGWLVLYLLLLIRAISRGEAAYLERCRAAGVDRALLALPSENRDQLMPAIDKYATLLE